MKWRRSEEKHMSSEFQCSPCRFRLGGWESWGNEPKRSDILNGHFKMFSMTYFIVL